MVVNTLILQEEEKEKCCVEIFVCVFFKHCGENSSSVICGSCNIVHTKGVAHSIIVVCVQIPLDNKICVGVSFREEGTN